jgi:hypothetical protein
VVKRQGNLRADRSRTNRSIDGLDLRRRFAECIWEFSTFDWRSGTAADKMIERRRRVRGEEGDNLGRSDPDP